MLSLFGRLGVCAKNMPFLSIRSTVCGLHLGPRPAARAAPRPAACSPGYTSARGLHPGLHLSLRSAPRLHLCFGSGQRVGHVNPGGALLACPALVPGAHYVPDVFKLQSSKLPSKCCHFLKMSYYENDQTQSKGVGFIDVCNSSCRFFLIPYFGKIVAL